MIFVVELSWRIMKEFIKYVDLIEERIIALKKNNSINIIALFLLIYNGLKT